jgi:hypothetical protein
VCRLTVATVPKVRVKRLLVTAALVLFAMSLAAAAARAARTASPPANNSAIAQYFEQVPSSTGSQAPGVTKDTEASLSTDIEAALRRYGGQDAAVLRKIATSSALGAPTATTSGGDSPSDTPLITAVVVVLVSTIALGVWRVGLAQRSARER